jgi:hypothetical protein
MAEEMDLMGRIEVMIKLQFPVQILLHIRIANLSNFSFTSSCTYFSTLAFSSHCKIKMCQN